MNENQQYTFRVSARNECGSSIPCEMSGYILVKDQTAAPDVDLGGLAMKVVEGKAGSDILVDVRQCIFYKKTKDETDMFDQINIV